MSTTDVTSRIPVPEPELTPDDMLARAVEMRPVLRELQAETEERSYYSEAVHERFREAGFYRVLQPRMFGGYEFSVRDYYRLVGELARGCPSTGWCFALGSAHVLNVASIYGQQAQSEIFAPDGHFICASRGTPTATARPVDGGWVVDGRWDYLSGAPYSTHVHVAVRLPATDGGEEPVGMAVVPRDQWTMLDDWRGMLGMRGSGSHSVVAENAHVPEGWVTSVYLGAVSVEQTQGGEIHGNPMYATPVFAFLTGELTSIAIGMVRAAIDEHAETLMSKKMRMPPFELRAANPEMQQTFGHALGLVDCAEAVLLRAADLHAEYARRGAEGGEPFGPGDDVRIAATLVQADRFLLEAMDMLMRTAGSSAARDGSRMQRYWRDMTLFRGHITNVAWERFARQNGAAYLGVEDDPLTQTGF